MPRFSSTLWPTLTFLASGGGLPGCAASPPVEADSDRLLRTERLRVDMTWDEVTAQVALPTNCRGRPEASEDCEWKFESPRPDAYLAPAVAMAATRNSIIEAAPPNYFVYSLHFEKRRLKSWIPRIESEFLRR